ncbi:hypothetical protein B0H11DRAFT_2246807 [Mycena galericulata]|nr:hypothetical protein B0H11DRAFT_2246807 [Mycena galericulata]
MTTQTKLVPTNLRRDELVMDERGVKDRRYYCLPPFRSNRSLAVSSQRGGRFPLYIVTQGHIVGTFNTWPEAKASISGYPDFSHQGCQTEDECIDVWQRLCALGIHPHPADPALTILPGEGAAPFVNISPRKTRGKTDSPVKRETTPGPSTGGNAQLLADLKRFASPIRPNSPSPSKSARAADEAAAAHVNFAIRGAGIVSSSVVRTEERYREMQRRGEEPDMLVTRSIRQASLFALDDEDEDA